MVGSLHFGKRNLNIERKKGCEVGHFVHGFHAAGIEAGKGARWVDCCYSGNECRSLDLYHLHSAIGL